MRQLQRGRNLPTAAARVTQGPDLRPVHHHARTAQRLALRTPRFQPSAKNFDAIIFDYYDAGRLMYSGRTRSGFTPSSRQQLFKRFKGLEVEKCPFANLLAVKSGRWGEGLTAEKMKDCRCLQPVLVGQFEYVEWAPDAHFRHSRFIGIRDDKDARDVRRAA